MSKDFHRSVSPDQSGLRKQRSLWSYTHLDFPLLLLLLALCVSGLVILYSASGQDWAYVERQAIRMAAGFAALVFLAQVPPRVIMRVGPWLYLLGVGLLVGVILFGVGAKGAQRWLALPGFRFQPSELMKLVLPIVVAGYIARYTLPPNFKALIVSVILIAIPFALIMKQPDLGTSLLIGASGVFILLFSGIYWRWIFLSAGIVAASLPGLWMIMKDYQKVGT